MKHRLHLGTVALVAIVAAYGAVIGEVPDAFACRAVAGASEMFA